MAVVVPVPAATDVHQYDNQGGSNILRHGDLSDGFGPNGEDKEDQNVSVGGSTKSSSIVTKSKQEQYQPPPFKSQTAQLLLSKPIPGVPASIIIIITKIFSFLFSSFSYFYNQRVIPNRQPRGKFVVFENI